MTIAISLLNHTSIQKRMIEINRDLFLSTITIKDIYSNGYLSVGDYIYNECIKILANEFDTDVNTMCDEVRTITKIMFQELYQ